MKEARLGKINTAWSPVCLKVSNAQQQRAEERVWNSSRSNELYWCPAQTGNWGKIVVYIPKFLSNFKCCHHKKSTWADESVNQLDLLKTSYCTPYMYTITSNFTEQGQCWRGCRESEAILQSWEECKLIHSLWKTAQQFLGRFKTRAIVWSSNPISYDGTKLVCGGVNCSPSLLQHDSRQLRHNPGACWQRNEWAKVVL